MGCVVCLCIASRGAAWALWAPPCTEDQVWCEALETLPPQLVLLGSDKCVVCLALHETLQHGFAVLVQLDLHKPTLSLRAAVGKTGVGLHFLHAKSRVSLTHCYLSG